MSNYIITMGLNLYVLAKGRLTAILIVKCPNKITLRVCQDATVHKHSFLQDNRIAKHLYL